VRTGAVAQSPSAMGTSRVRLRRSPGEIVAREFDQSCQPRRWFGLEFHGADNVVGVEQDISKIPAIVEFDLQ